MVSFYKKVFEDKELEATNGHDGTWMAHPGLAETVLSAFDAVLGERAKANLMYNVMRKDHRRHVIGPL